MTQVWKLTHNGQAVSLFLPADAIVTFGQMLLKEKGFHQLKFYVV